jgi:hypothetical protein
MHTYISCRSSREPKSIQVPTGKWREATDVARKERQSRAPSHSQRTSLGSLASIVNCEEIDCANDGSLSNKVANSEYHLKQHLVKRRVDTVLLEEELTSTNQVAEIFDRNLRWD